MEIQQAFPERLRLLRQSLGLTMEQFANRVGVARPTMQLYEGGQRVPNIVIFGKICDGAPCSPDYLLGRVPVSPSMKTTQKNHVEPDAIARLCGKYSTGPEDTLDAFLQRKHRDKELYES